MKHHHLYAFILLITLFTFQAEAKKLEGTAFYENETLTVTLHIPTGLKGIRFDKLEMGIDYYSKDGTRAPLLLYKLNQVRFNYNGKMIVMRTVPQTWKNEFPKRKFVRVESSNEGLLQVCSYTDYVKSSFYNSETNLNTNIQSAVTRYFMIKNNKVTRVPDGKFKRFIRDYFKDCITLIAKVEIKRLGKKHLGSIVDFYNSSCQ